MTPRAVLVGLPGSGKSTIGRRLAKALGVDMLDTDAAIEEQTMLSWRGIRSWMKASARSKPCTSGIDRSSENAPR